MKFSFFFSFLLCSFFLRANTYKLEGIKPEEEKKILESVQKQYPSAEIKNGELIVPDDVRRRRVRMILKQNGKGNIKVRKDRGEVKNN